MGVAGLWDVLRPASKIQSLTELAVNDGFAKNLHGARGYRIGIDASIWSFHMKCAREGENPQLRTLFFRCARLMRSPFLLLFVFDGPKRPDFKRGKEVNKTPNKLIPSMKLIIEAFGFEHRTAPGEAEAELAYLNRLGIIDGILSDDVDSFLFGGTTVIRNPSNNLFGNKSKPGLNAAGKDDNNHTLVCKLSDITAHPDIGLTKGGFILIGLLSGGDYHAGLTRCGIKTAVALAKCGFGDSLYQAATTLPRARLPAFLDSWRNEMRHEIQTNSQGLIGRKSPKLAKNLTSAFPDIDVMMAYINPVTSESMGKPYRSGDIRWDQEPDISEIAGICEFFFDWGYKEAIIRRFRTVIWHSAVLRILRRAVLELDQGKHAGPSSIPQPPFSTPSRSDRRLDAVHCGTPSKMIAKHFSSMDIGDRFDYNDDDADPLIVKIHSKRTHVYTDGMLEYRLEISPAQLVHLAEMGVKGTREKPTQEWEDETEQEDKGQANKDPFEHMRVWMPACMVKMVEPKLVEEFDAVEGKKTAKEANKGKGRAWKERVEDSDGDDAASFLSKLNTVPALSRNAPANDRNEDPILPIALPKGMPMAGRPAAASKGKAVSTYTSTRPAAKEKLRHTATELSADDQSDYNMLPPRSHPSAPARPAVFNLFHSANEPAPFPSPTRRAGVRDLTQKDKSLNLVSLSRTNTSTITSYFPACGSSSGYLSRTIQKAKGTRNTSSSSYTTTNKDSAIETASTATRNAVAGPSSARNTGATFPLTFFDDHDSLAEERTDDSSRSDALRTSRTPSPPKSAPSKRSTQDTIDLNGDDPFNFPPVFPRQPTTTKANVGPSAAPSSSALASPPKSPSRRKRTLSISDSESDSRDRYQKSPRSSALHYSPARALSSAASPTSQDRFASDTRAAASTSRKLFSTSDIESGQIKTKVDSKTLPVYEISSDDDDEDDVVFKPAAPPKSTSRMVAGNVRVSKNREDVSPLTRAKGKSAWKNTPVRKTIIIDLT